MKSNAYVFQLGPTLCKPWTVAHQAPLFMGFSRQEYWSSLQFPPLGDLPNSGTELVSLMSPALASQFFTSSITWEAPLIHIGITMRKIMVISLLL